MPVASSKFDSRSSFSTQQTYAKTDFGPRLGFAYDVSGDARLVVRGGFGVFWNFTPGGTSSSKAQNPPFLQSTERNIQLAMKLSV